MSVADSAILSAVSPIREGIFYIVMVVVLGCWGGFDGDSDVIIIVTAYPTHEHRSRTLKDCATSFLTKPLDERVLVGRLARAIVVMC